MDSMSVPSGDQSVSPYKQMMINNSKKSARAFTANNPPENWAPSNVLHGGVLFGPPFSVSFSCPPSIFKPPPYPYNQNQQPPLLPLPLMHAATAHNSMNNLRRGISCPSTTRKSKAKEANKKKDDLPKLLTPVESELWGSLLTVSPPPSSLPLPGFSLRSKLSCNGGGIDAGATDNLRRLLRLR